MDLVDLKQELKIVHEQTIPQLDAVLSERIGELLGGLRELLHGAEIVITIKMPDAPKSKIGPKPT